jgi:hypothetical protein
VIFFALRFTGERDMTSIIAVVQGVAILTAIVLATICLVATIRISG